MRTQCCNYEATEDIPYPVKWNEFNEVVQCHNCGEAYLPASIAVSEFKRGCEKTMEWVYKTCKENTERLATLNSKDFSP